MALTQSPLQSAQPSVQVWDAALRAFHWLLLAAVASAIATGLAGGEWMVWHGRAGLWIMGLLAFRLAWGLLGSTTSRFRHFFPSYQQVRAYLSGRWQGVGHNPLGALSVFALLGALAAQAGTGLFSHDDITFAGPLASLVGDELIQDSTAWHHRLTNVLYGLISLHLAAILFHTVVKRDGLVKAMVTGRKPWPATAEPPQAHGGTKPAATSGARPWALLISLAAAVVCVWLASGAWIGSTEPTPSASPAAISAPAW